MCYLIKIKDVNFKCQFKAEIKIVTICRHKFTLKTTIKICYLGNEVPFVDLSKVFVFQPWTKLNILAHTLTVVNLKVCHLSNNKK